MHKQLCKGVNADSQQDTFKTTNKVLTNGQSVPVRGDGDPTGVDGFDGKLLLVWSGE